MDIKLNKKAQYFQLATNDGWEKVLGHGIKVGDHLFCIVPFKSELVISEAQSGAQLMNVSYPEELYQVLETKEEVMKLFEILGEEIKKVIESVDDFDEHVNQLIDMTKEQLGEKPNMVLWEGVYWEDV